MPAGRLASCLITAAGTEAGAGRTVLAALSCRLRSPLASDAAHRASTGRAPVGSVAPAGVTGWPQMEQACDLGGLFIAAAVGCHRTFMSGWS